MIDQPINEYVELSVDSFDVLCASLQAFFFCHVHLKSVGVLVVNILKKERLLTGQWIPRRL